MLTHIRGWREKRTEMRSPLWIDISHLPEESGVLISNLLHALGLIFFFA